MQCFIWLVGSFLALTVVAMDANQALTGLAYELQNLHLYDMAETSESSSRRPGTTLNSAAVPYWPNHARGKGHAAAHPDTAVEATIQASLQAGKNSLQSLLRQAKGTGPFRHTDLEKICKVIIATSDPKKWAAPMNRWMRAKMPDLIGARVGLVKAFDDLLTQLAKLWGLKPAPTDGHEALQQLVESIDHKDLRLLYWVAEDLEVLARLWNRRSGLDWPSSASPGMGPLLDVLFVEDNDAHLVALGRAIRHRISLIIDTSLLPRIEAIERVQPVPWRWTQDVSLVNGFAKRIMDLETLKYLGMFANEKISQDKTIFHTKLVERRQTLTRIAGSIRKALDERGRERFEKLLEMISRYLAVSKAKAFQALDQTATHPVLLTPAQPSQARPQGWVAMQGYAQPGVDETGQGVWNVRVQQAAIVPNPHEQYGPEHGFAQPQPGGYPGDYAHGYPGDYPYGYPGDYPYGYPGGYPHGHPHGYPVGAPSGPLQPPVRGQAYGSWDGHGHGHGYGPHA